MIGQVQWVNDEYFGFLKGEDGLSHPFNSRSGRFFIPQKYDIIDYELIDDPSVRIFRGTIYEKFEVINRIFPEVSIQKIQSILKIPPLSKKEVFVFTQDGFKFQVKNYNPDHQWIAIVKEQKLWKTCTTPKDGFEIVKDYLK